MSEPCKFSGEGAGRGLAGRGIPAHMRSLEVGRVPARGGSALPLLMVLIIETEHCAPDPASSAGRRAGWPDPAVLAGDGRCFVFVWNVVSMVLSLKSAVLYSFKLFVTQQTKKCRTVKASFKF